MTNEIEVYVSISDDVLVIAIHRDSGQEDLYAYRLSQEIDLYEKLLNDGAHETIMGVEDGEKYKQLLEKEEEIQRILDENYEVYSQDT